MFVAKPCAPLALYHAAYFPLNLFLRFEFFFSNICPFMPARRITLPLPVT